MLWTHLTIIFAFGGALSYTKNLLVVKKIRCKKETDAAKNLAREYYGDKNFKKRNGREANKI